MPALDDAEGLGSGYHEEIVHVLSPKGGEVVVCTYIADASFIDDSLQPYSWYKNFVLAGAEEHRRCTPFAIRTLSASKHAGPRSKLNLRAGFARLSSGAFGPR
jgi:hypothetical protein